MATSDPNKVFGHFFSNCLSEFHVIFQKGDADVFIHQDFDFQKELICLAIMKNWDQDFLTIECQSV